MAGACTHVRVEGGPRASAIVWRNPVQKGSSKACLYAERFAGKGPSKYGGGGPSPLLSPWKTSCDGWGSDRCACASRAGARWWCWWWRRRQPGAWWARAHFPDTCPRGAGARDWDGRRTRHGWHLHTTRPCVKSSEAPSPLHLSTRPCAGGHARLHASPEAHYGHDGTRQSKTEPVISAQQDENVGIDRPPLSMPNAGSTKLGSGHGSARRTQRRIRFRW